MIKVLILVLLTALTENVSFSQDFFDVPYVGEPDSVSLATAVSTQKMSVSSTGELRMDITYKFSIPGLDLSVFAAHTNFHPVFQNGGWVVPDEVRALPMTMGNNIPFVIPVNVTYAYVTNADLIGTYDLAANGRIYNIGGQGILLLGQVMVQNGKGHIYVGLSDGTKLVYSLKEGGFSLLSSLVNVEEGPIGFYHRVGFPDRMPISSRSDLLAHARTMVNDIQGYVYTLSSPSLLTETVEQSVLTESGHKVKIKRNKLSPVAGDMPVADCSGFGPYISGVRVYPDNTTNIGFVDRSEVIEVQYTSNLVVSLSIAPELPTYMKPSFVYVSTDCMSVDSTLDWQWFMSSTTPVVFQAQAGKTATIRFKP